MLVFFLWGMLVLIFYEVLMFGCGSRMEIHHLFLPKGLSEFFLMELFEDPIKGFDDDVLMELDEALNRGFEEISPTIEDPKLAPIDCEDVVDIVGID